MSDALARMSEQELRQFCGLLRRETKQAQSLLSKAERELKHRKRKPGEKANVGAG